MKETDLKTLSVVEAQEILKTNKNIKLLDVRELHEYEYCHLVESIHCPLSEFPQSFDKLNLNKSEKIIVYCHHGRRSAQAIMYLIENGFDNVYNLTGGIDEWSLEIDPNIPRY